jgi:DNA polymerase-3 subunit delta'
MRWTDIIGHTENIVRLQNMLSSGRMPHALLFAGPDGIGKRMVAQVVAASLLCVAVENKPCGQCPSCRQVKGGRQPDLLVISPEGATIKIDQIRNLQHEAALAPYGGQRRVCIIEDADKMTAQAANSLLKFLEEPPGEMVFILLSAGKQLLLETILSRCCVLAFQPLAYSLLAEALVSRGVLPEQAKVAARLSGGGMGTALKLVAPDGLVVRNQAASIVVGLLGCKMMFVWDTAGEWEKLERRELLAVLQYMRYILRDLLMLAAGQELSLLFNLDLASSLQAQVDNWNETRLIAALSAVERARQALRGNANSRLTSEALLIKLRDLAGED